MYALAHLNLSTASFKCLSYSARHFRTLRYISDVFVLSRGACFAIVADTSLSDSCFCLLT